MILHRVASAEMRRPRQADDVTDAAEQPAHSVRSPARFLRCREVCARTGLSRTTLWRLECRGQFPSRRQLSANTVGWLEADVEGWIATRVCRRERQGTQAVSGAIVRALVLVTGDPRRPRKEVNRCGRSCESGPPGNYG